MSKRQMKGPKKAHIRPKVHGGGKNAVLGALGKFRKIAGSRIQLQVCKHLAAYRFLSYLFSSISFRYAIFLRIGFTFILESGDASKGSFSRSRLGYKVLTTVLSGCYDSGMGILPRRNHLLTAVFSEKYAGFFKFPAGFSGNPRELFLINIQLLYKIETKKTSDAPFEGGKRSNWNIFSPARVKQKGHIRALV